MRQGGEFVLIGGQGERALGDAWTFNFATRRWAELPLGLPERARFAWAVDPESRRLVLAGGRADSGPLVEAWVSGVDGSPARLIIGGAGGPAARVGAAIAWDAGSKRWLLYGGRGAAELAELWTLDVKAGV
jgi:hypothetical protein